MDKGFFGSLFDLNGDGKLDMFERFLDFKAFEDLVLKDDDTEDDDDN